MQMAKMIRVFGGKLAALGSPCIVTCDLSCKMKTLNTKVAEHQGLRPEKEN
jgi:hypothetical protein